ncbi:MAG: polysaccharide deacetylase family protein [Proteobacteria bacterium]|nr:polysaccharide deacetylase family protein [Pseudomonadota bacterium]MDA1355295.1 polysaccharide deacetylase family protein [Pseudomonadota bacterium]
MTSATDEDWPRDYIGYGANPPHAQWPGGARVAVNFNLNYECGGEANILDGDDASEGMLNDIGFPPVPGKRNPLAESAFEYGSRVGVWRVLRIFKKFDVKMSILGVATALERNPEATRAFVEGGHEIVSHGLRWIDYHFIAEAEERAHIHQAAALIQKVAGVKPIGWMTGRPGPNTRRLLIEHGGFHYDRDALNDELPYWTTVGGMPHLVIPYSYETNDNRCDQSNGFAQSDDFYQYMRDAFDLMYEEGEDRPGLLSIGLHDRLIGRPARAVGLIKLLDHMQSKGDVWFCTGADVAAHWRKTHPYQA